MQWRVIQIVDYGPGVSLSSSLWPRELHGSGLDAEDGKSAPVSPDNSRQTCPENGGWRVPCNLKLTERDDPNFSGAPQKSAASMTIIFSGGKRASRRIFGIHQGVEDEKTVTIGDLSPDERADAVVGPQGITDRGC